MHTEKTLESQLVFAGKVITLRQDKVALENGGTATREVVHHSGGAGVAALDDEGNITLIRQYRYALGQELVEIPAGKLEPGEDPLAAAQRELAEEAGLAAKTYVSLGHTIPTCGYSDEKIYIYAAKNLNPVPQNLDEDEFVTLFKLPLQEAVAQVLAGEIADGKTALAILKLSALVESGAF